jgi:hypothetical protein
MQTRETGIKSGKMLHRKKQEHGGETAEEETRDRQMERLGC